MVILFLLFIIQFSLAVALLAITQDTQKEIARKGWDTSSNETRIEFMHAATCCGFDTWKASDPFCVSSVLMTLSVVTSDPYIKVKENLNREWQYGQNI